jgi:hypothetical protein
MALIIEDGSIVADANSYNTAQQLRDYASLRGVVITASDQELEQWLVRATDYLEGLREKFKGERVSNTQPLQWPRTNVLIDDAYWPSTSIPRELQYAQLSLALEINAGHELQPTFDPTKQSIVRKKMDKLGEIAYSDPTQSRSHTPAFAKADTLLKPLLRNQGFFIVRA